MERFIGLFAVLLTPSDVIVDSILESLFSCFDRVSLKSNEITSVGNLAKEDIFLFIKPKKTNVTFIFYHVFHIMF